MKIPFLKRKQADPPVFRLAERTEIANPDETHGGMFSCLAGRIRHLLHLPSNSSDEGAEAVPPYKMPNQRKRAYSYMLEFRCHGEMLFSFNTDSLPSVVKIGKSEDNDWVIPKTDRVSGDYQAELHLTAKEITLNACKGRSFFLSAQPEIKAVLKNGMRSAIGDCELFVQNAKTAAVRPSDVHRLEIKNGAYAGKIIRLEKQMSRIGSDPDNDIVFPDKLISRHHVEIRITENGEPWIKDLNSVNGTIVNGKKLGRQERMLMDSDEISAAWIDMLFLDRNVQHTRSHILRNLLIMGATLLVILVFFAVYYIASPQCSMLLTAADYYLRRADFPAARRMVERMPESRDFSQYEKAYAAYLGYISRYEKTMSAWRDFKDSLRKSDWEKAESISGKLDSDNRLAWNWEDASVDIRMEQVKYSKKLLDHQFNLLAFTSALDIAPEHIRKVRDQALASLYAHPEFGKNEPDWLQPLCKAISLQIKQLVQICEFHRQIDVQLELLNDAQADLNNIRQEMSKIRDKSFGSVQIRAQEIIEDLGDMKADFINLNKNRDAFFSMRFSDFCPGIQFSNPEESAFEPLLMKKRRWFISNQEQLSRQVTQLQWFLNHLSRHGCDARSVPEAIHRFSSEKEIEKAYSFACLDAPRPEGRTGKVLDDYDRMFGIRYFYGIIRQCSELHTNLFSYETNSTLKFTPECAALVKIFHAAEDVVIYLNAPQNKWMLRGKILELNNYCLGILRQRAEMIRIFQKIAARNPGTRKYFAATAAVFYFSTPSSVPAEQMHDFSRKWKKFRARQAERLELIDPLDAATAAEIERKILSSGLPGDPTVNSIWRK